MDALSPGIEAPAQHILPARHRGASANLVSPLDRVLQLVLRVQYAVYSDERGVEEEERAIDSLRPVPHLIGQLLNVLVLKQVHCFILANQSDHISSFEISVGEDESGFFLLLYETHDAPGYLKKNALEIS